MEQTAFVLTIAALVFIWLMIPDDDDDGGPDWTHA